MNLFIKIKDNKPFDHPILEDNMRMLFDDFDSNNPPEGFAKFERIDLKAGHYDIYTELPYFIDTDGVVKNGTVRPMTPEEKQTKINDMLQSKPFESWIFNEEEYRWDPPVPRPDGGLYYWNETTKEWLLYDPNKQI